MSNNIDKDIHNMDDIKSLMDDLFAADESAVDMVQAVSNELQKMDGSLEKFSEEEAARHDQMAHWLEDPHNNSVDGYHLPPPYESDFGGVEKHNLNQLNNQTITGRDKVIFEKDEMNSSLAGVKNVTGIEDIHDFFSVGRGQTFDYDSAEVDEQISEIQKMSHSEQNKLDQTFVDDILGMDIQRLREVSGATSAWKEIVAIKQDLEEIERNTKKVAYRFEQFIDLYVKDKIPK